MNFKVRFPPSPTGFAHIGTARMAVVNYLFAKKHGGSIIFRSEDTDRERSTKEFENDIIEQLQWLGLAWDEFYRQSERTLAYTSALKHLISEGRAYESEEESQKEPGKKVRVVRLKNPGTIVTFEDVLRGTITFDTTELKDFAIARTVDDPLYHFAVVFDDGDMGVTHVIRGEDHISNTPRQILIQEALGLLRPVYAHYPLHLAADRSKLSKRKGDVAVRSYRERGYLAPALLNYIARLGWTPPSEREIMSLDEMVAEFELSDLNKSGAVFDSEKLRWYNREYILKMSDAQFSAYSLGTLKKSIPEWDETIGHYLLPLIRERVSANEDIAALVEAGELSFFFRAPQLERAAIKGKNGTDEVAQKHLAYVHNALPDIVNFSQESIREAIWDYATREGRGAVLWPLRYALSGKEKSPDPFLIASIIGKEETLRRVDTAIRELE